jgi:hypothetical protein
MARLQYVHVDLPSRILFAQQLLRLLLECTYVYVRREDTFVLFPRRLPVGFLRESSRSDSVAEYEPRRSSLCGIAVWLGVTMTRVLPPKLANSLVLCMPFFSTMSPAGNSEQKETHFLEGCVHDPSKNAKILYAPIKLQG